jgi:hypothetical protein
MAMERAEGIGWHTGRERNQSFSGERANGLVADYLWGFLCFLQVAGELVKSKATYVAIGDLYALSLRNSF